MLLCEIFRGCYLYNLNPLEVIRLVSSLQLAVLYPKSMHYRPSGIYLLTIFLYMQKVCSCRNTFFLPKSKTTRASCTKNWEVLLTVVTSRLQMQLNLGSFFGGWWSTDKESWLGEIQETLDGVIR